MGIPIVIATNGYGTPITEAANGYGTPVEIATNGYGMPVVIVASGGLPVVGSGGAVGGYDPSSEVIFASFTTPRTTQRKTDINNCVLALKAAGVWTKLDVLYGFAAADSQAAAINWKVPGTYNATAVNTPAFAADLGFTGGGTAYLDSGFNPTTAPTPNIVQNSAVIFGWSLTNASVVGGIIGQAASGAGEAMIYPLNAGNTNFYIHQTTTSSVANADGSGLFTVTRRAAGSAEAYRNTTSLGTSAQTSVAPINQNYNILRRATNYWTGQAAAAGFGSQLSAVEVTALHDALRAYLTGVGVP